MKQIDSIINECLNKYVKDIINESLNNIDYPLYHTTEMHKLISMMETNSIHSSDNTGFLIPNDENGSYGTHNAICFTRKRTYQVYTQNNVLIKFNPHKLRSRTKIGLKLIPFQDIEWLGNDEYEERLLARNNQPFVLNNLEELVDEVLIILDSLCEYIVENGEDIDSYIDEIKEIYNNNIFGDKLKIVEYIDSKKPLTLFEAVKYMKETCRDEYNSDNGTDSYIYSIEYYEEITDSWEHEEFTFDRHEALLTAEQMYKDDGFITRVTYGKKDNYSYESLGIVEIFGEK